MFFTEGKPGNTSGRIIFTGPKIEFGKYQISNRFAKYSVVNSICGKTDGYIYVVRPDDVYFPLISSWFEVDK
jgi:hypothetical protein